MAHKSQTELNLVGTSCPMAFVKARVYLDQCVEGDVVTIYYGDTKANEPLVRSISALGHSVLSQTHVPAAFLATAADQQTPTPPLSAEIQVKRIEVQVKV